MTFYGLDTLTPATDQADLNNLVTDLEYLKAMPGSIWTGSLAGDITTTSTTWSQITAMTTTVPGFHVASGTAKALVIARFNSYISDAAQKIHFTIDVNGTKLGGTDGIVQYAFPFAGATGTLFGLIHEIVDLPQATASRDIALYWKVTGGTGTIENNATAYPLWLCKIIGFNPQST